jgi:DNA-binding transcriptional LysR family regulator
MEPILNFDIDCLRSFVIVADTMSVSRAADGVGRSQSTVSQQIAKLETQVGKPLLSRRKGRVIELTSEGGKLLQFARRILQLNDEAYASMSDDVLTGFVRLGVPYDFFGRDFAAWIALFKNRHPMVGLEIEANQSENLLKRSERGDFDLTFFKPERKMARLRCANSLCGLVGRTTASTLWIPSRSSCSPRAALIGALRSQL